MDDPVHEETYQGHTIKIYHDNDAESPRDWDNLGTLICGHSRYQLGDKHEFDDARSFLLDLLDLDVEMDLPVNDLIKRVEKIAVILPVYLYDHSGLAMNTTGFHCPWDSGQIGFIYVTLTDIRKEYSATRVSAKLREQAAIYLRNEVQTFSDYISGAVYGYVVEKEDEEIDSCWGFIGDYGGYCLREARACLPAQSQ